MRWIAAGAAALALTVAAGQASGQQDTGFKERIAGVWIVTRIKDVSATGGEERDSWKGQTRGQIMFGADGRFSQILLGPPVDAMKSDEPRKPDSLILAQYGTYKVDDPAKTISIKIEGAGNSRVNSESSWTVRQTDDTLTLTGTARTNSEGTFKPTIEMKRP